MPSYKVANLKEVEDQAPKFGHSPDLEARFAGSALELESSGVSYQRLAPDIRAPFGHKHSEQEELYVVVGGSGRLKLDDDVVELKAWDAVRVAPEVTRAFEGGPDGIEILAFGAPKAGSPAEDVEMIPGWWSD
jgi:uncharacterized cupin superfamily protein